MNEPIKRGGIYMVRLEKGEGSEQSGIRPFLVLQNDMGNEHSFTHTGVPLSTELKALYLPTHIVTDDSKCLEYASVLLIEQMRSLSRKRFISYLGKLEPNTLKRVEVAVNIQLNLRDIGEINDLVFVKRLSEINKAVNMFICGKCLRKLRKVKELAVNGIPNDTDEMDYCSVCHKAKGRKFKVVNRKRLKRDEKKNPTRVKG